jgi:hypothetical protein
MKTMIEDIKNKAQVDIVVLCSHWGYLCPVILDYCFDTGHTAIDVD